MEEAEGGPPPPYKDIASNSSNYINASDSGLPAYSGYCPPTCEDDPEEDSFQDEEVEETYPIHGPAVYSPLLDPRPPPARTNISQRPLSPRPNTNRRPDSSREWRPTHCVYNFDRIVMPNNDQDGGIISVFYNGPPDPNVNTLFHKGVYVGPGSPTRQMA